MKKLVEFFGFADDPDFQPLGTYPSITRKPGCKSLDEPLPDRAAKFRAALDSWCEEHTVEEVNQIFGQMGVAVSPHMTYEMMLNDPHYQAREVFVDCYDEITQKTIKQVNMIPRFKKHPGKIVRGGAKYDADTRDVLEEFGYSEEKSSCCTERGCCAKASSETAREKKGEPPSALTMACFLLIVMALGIQSSTKEALWELKQ